MTGVNGVMMQYFHWYSPADGTLWETFAVKANELAETGIYCALASTRLQRDWWLIGSRSLRV